MATTPRKNKRTTPIPEPSLRRLPWYLSFVKLLQAEGEIYVSSTRIARGVGVDAALVAKDLSFVQLKGRTRVGYEVAMVIQVLESFLGFTLAHKASLLGVGSLGAALLSDRGLKQFGLEIVAGYDVSPQVLSKGEISEIPVYHVDALADHMATEPTSIAILTVPIHQAQAMADRAVELGFKAIWNFTPVRIQVPEGIVVQNTSMYAHLALMFSRMLSPKG